MNTIWLMVHVSLWNSINRRNSFRKWALWWSVPVPRPPGDFPYTNFACGQDLDFLYSNVWGRSWWNLPFSKHAITFALIFETNFWGAILMTRSIFKGYNHVTYDIFKRKLWGRSRWNDLFSKNKITWPLIFQTEFIRASHVWLQTFA